MRQVRKHGRRGREVEGEKRRQIEMGPERKHCSRERERRSNLRQ